VVLQLGGDEPVELAQATAVAQEYGYAEVNLNVGCPSERVSSGNFGACLMASPAVVGECLAAMAEASSLPVSVKHRIGIDDLDTYEHLLAFVDAVDEVSGGVPVAYTVHARKAWLSGLSPKENRTVPPLRYDDVYRLKADRPGLTVELNGGVLTVEQALLHLERVDGVMIGRAAYENPVILAAVDPLVFGQHGAATSRADVVAALLPYVEGHLASGGRVAGVSRHLLNLFRGVPGGRAWRRKISEGAHLDGAGPGLLEEALRAVPAEVAHAPLWLQGEPERAQVAAPAELAA
jgi:tRNA-dihydrouridine synthase A